jgi:hypothetical protein
MWAIVDENGQDLAENLTSPSSLIRGENRGRRIMISAKALRFAVKKLRRKRRIPLERWVNFRSLWGLTVDYL